MVFELFQSDSQIKNSVYPLWLRFFTLLAGVVFIIILVGPSSLLSNSDPKLPWNQEYRIVAPGQTSRLELSETQPQITRILRYKTEAEQDGSPRGNINLLIYPEGIVRGVWNGEYDRADGVHCVVIAASFAGNTDTSKKFVDEDGTQDASKLYFITKGTYSLFERDLSTHQGRNASGFIYVCGWLDTDHIVFGEATITENKRSYETFEFAASPVN